MHKETIVVGCVALVAGAALGYIVHSSAPDRSVADAVAPVPKAAIATDTDASSRALRAQVRDLQAQLAAARAASATVATQETARIDFPRDEKDRKRFGEEMKARFEQWKKDNPEEFAKMEKRRQEFMKRRAEKAKSRLDFLASIDTSKMSEGEKEVHEKLQSLLAKREELESKMSEMPDLSDEEREQLFTDMRETHQAIREANEQERETLFKQTAEALGFQGEDVGEIATTMKDIVEATENGHGGGGPGPGGPGGGAPGGGPRH